MANELYFLKADHQSDWTEVSKEEWVKAERRAGFRPKGTDYDQPATGGFGGSGVSGRIAYTWTQEAIERMRGYGDDAFADAIERATREVPDVPNAENLSTNKPWPEWLTPEHSAIHTAIYNEIVKALEHCYASADAAGVAWTTEGHYSVSANNIINLLRRSGCPPPAVEPQQRLDLQAVLAEWWHEPEYVDMEPCATCDGTGMVEVSLADESNA